MNDHQDLAPRETADGQPEIDDAETVGFDQAPTEEFGEDDPEHPGENVLDDWIVYPSMAAGIVATTFFPILLGQRICLPLLSAAVLFPMFIWALRQGRPRKAITLGIFWVVVQSASVIAASLLFQDSAWRAVQGGLEYHTAWLQWVEGGPLVSMAPAMDYLRQAIDLAVYAVAMAATGGAGGLVLLTAALNRFNFTVATMLASTSSPLLLALAAWPLWMIVRMVGFVIVGAVLAEPVANLDLRPAYLARWFQRRKRMLLAGLGVILLGIILQVLLSPLYQTILQNILE